MDCLLCSHILISGFSVTKSTSHTHSSLPKSGQPALFIGVAGPALSWQKYIFTKSQTSSCSNVWNKKSPFSTWLIQVTKQPGLCLAWMWYVYIQDIYLLSICTGGKEAVVACFLAHTLNANVHVLSDLPTQHQLHSIKYDPILTERPHVPDLLQFAKLLSPNTALSSTLPQSTFPEHL